MGTFEVERVVAASPAEVWAVVADWHGYSRWMPLTRMRVDEGPTRVGRSFAGLTGVGLLRFSDSMIVTEWEPPAGSGGARFRVVKTGWWLAGWAEVRLTPLEGGSRTRLDWRERITVRPAPLGRLLAPLLDPANRVLFTSVVAKMARTAERQPKRVS